MNGTEWKVSLEGGLIRKLLAKGRLLSPGARRGLSIPMTSSLLGGGEPSPRPHPRGRLGGIDGKSWLVNTTALTEAETATRLRIKPRFEDFS